MKTRYFLIFFFLFLSCSSFAMGNSQNQDSSQNNASLDQAKKDYAVFLQKLNEMSQQYGQVTSQVKEVVKEQGVPVWDEQTGTMKVSHDVNFTSGAPIYETEKEIKVVLEKPGLRKNSIVVTIEDDKTLRVHAFKKAQIDGQPEEPVDVLYSLPAAAAAAHPKARYEDGILTVTIQKSLTPKKSVFVPVQ